MEQRFAFGSGEILADSLESIPNRDVGIRRFVDREVAFEHAALNSELLYAKIEIGRDYVCQLGRIELECALVPVIAGPRRPETAQL
jgi:hypothetical protein